MKHVAGTLLCLCLVAAASPSMGRAATPQSSCAALLEKARGQIGRGEFDPAIQTLTLAREAAPDNANVYNELAAVYSRQGAEPMAVTQLEKSLAVDSTQVEARLRLAEIRLRNRQWAEAGLLYREILRRDPAHDQAALQLGLLYLKAKQPGSAAQALVGYVGRHPEDDATAQQYLVALETGPDARAAEAAESILQARAGWPPALRVAARAQARLGHADQALVHYLSLEKTQPLDAGDAAAVGQCYIALNDDASAVSWFERALRGPASAATDWAEPAAAFMRLKRWSEAADLYERKLTRDSTSVSAWLNYALCEQQMHAYEPGRRALLRALALRPGFIAAQYHLSTNYVLMDSTRAACRSYEKLTDLAAGHEAEHREELRQAYRYLSVTYMLEKSWKRALENLDATLRLDPKDVEMRLYRAQTLFALDRKPEARQDFELVLRQQPGNKEAQKGLGLLAQYN